MSEKPAMYNPKPEAPSTVPDTAIIEEVVARGNLSQLTPEQRVNYYRAVCDSLELNPLTKPFEYITLNGKLTLYARKDATDQLRARRGISITRIEREIVDDVVIATAHAETKDGRKDFDIGIVSLQGLSGEAKANAIMKAVTKAKRRVTLSICGLGFLDETEVETIPEAQPLEAPPVVQVTDQAAEESPEEEPEALPASAPASEADPDLPRRRFFAWLTEHQLPQGGFMRWLGREMFHVPSRNELTPAQWDALTAFCQEHDTAWFTAAIALWNTAHHEAFQDAETALLAFIPSRFDKEHLWELSLEEFRQSDRALKRHLENDVDAFCAQVLQWYRETESSGSKELPF